MNMPQPPEFSIEDPADEWDEEARELWNRSLEWLNKNTIRKQDK